MCHRGLPLVMGPTQKKHFLVFSTQLHSPALPPSQSSPLSRCQTVKKEAASSSQSLSKLYTHSLLFNFDIIRTYFEKEKEENAWSLKIFGLQRKRKMFCPQRKSKRREIFGERRHLEKGNIWRRQRREIFGEGKFSVLRGERGDGKFMERDNICRRKITEERKWRKYLERERRKKIEKQKKQKRKNRKRRRKKETEYICFS